MDIIWYVLFGAIIFMLGGCFGVLIMAIAQAAARPMPKPTKDET